MTINDALLNVSFLAEELCSKLYKLSYLKHHPSYLLQVTIPVKPYFKTESEVAMIAYLRAHTSIPAPRVIAWQSNINNELGYEWLLMEVIEGVPLRRIWRKISWNRKLQLSDELAGLVKELQDHQFNAIGAMYFRSALEKGVEEPTATEEQIPLINTVAANERAETQPPAAGLSVISSVLQKLGLQTPSPNASARSKLSKVQLRKQLEAGLRLRRR